MTRLSLVHLGRLLSNLVSPREYLVLLPHDPRSPSRRKPTKPYAFVASLTPVTGWRKNQLSRIFNLSLLWQRLPRKPSKRQRPSAAAPRRKSFSRKRKLLNRYSANSLRRGSSKRRQAKFCASSPV